jgi:hypothetical protein
MVVSSMITYAATVWWPREMFKASTVELSKMQRMACLGITEDKKTTLIAATVLLILPMLHLKLEAEVQAGIYKRYCTGLRKPNSEGYSMGTPNTTYRWGLTKLYQDVYISLPWSDFLTKVNGKAHLNLTEKVE